MRICCCLRGFDTKFGGKKSSKILCLEPNFYRGGVNISRKGGVILCVRTLAHIAPAARAFWRKFRQFSAQDVQYLLCSRMAVTSTLGRAGGTIPACVGAQDAPESPLYCRAPGPPPAHPTTKGQKALTRVRVSL